MQHATCNKNGNKLVSFLAVLALIASSLAIHQSASAYGAYRIFALDGNSTYRNPSCPAILEPGANTCPQSNRFFVGVSFDEEQSNAETAALANCNTKRNALLNDGYTPATGVVCRTDPLSHNAFSDTFVNQCFAYAGQNGDPLADEISHGLGDDAAAARANALTNCRNHDGGGNACQLLDLATPAVNITTFANRADDADFTTAVCDHTCVLADNQFIVDNPSDNAGCRPARENSECEMVDSTTPYFDSTIGDSGGCRAALECGTSTDGEGRTTDGGCETCPEDEFNNQCVAACVAPETRNTDGNCVDMTDMTDDDMTDDDMTDDDMTDDMTDGETAPEFSYSIGDTAVTATEESPHPVAFADTGAIAINIAANNGEFVYAKTGGSDELMVSTVGIVSFMENTTISAGNYNIFVSAAQNQTIIANLSLYLTVAAEIMDEQPPEDDSEEGSGDEEEGSGGEEGDMSEETPGIPSSETAGKEFLGIIGTGMVAIAAYWLITDWADKARWTPSYAFANNNGNVSYSVGSRWTATEDNWRVYWQTRQNGDKFVYGSGIGYNNGILSAAINSQSESDKTNMNLDLAANKTVGLWNLGGGYNFDMQLSETETESQNRLNAKVRYTMDKWILSANANTDGDTGMARINYSYRF